MPADVPGAQAVSSAHGPLRHVFFCFAEEAARRPGYSAAYTDLFGQLPASTRLTVLVHPKVVDDFAGVLADSGVADRTDVLVAPDGMEFTVWAQDPFIVVGSRLVQPACFEPEDDDAVAPLLAAATGMDVARSRLRFHGGNVLVGDDFALVSRDCLADGGDAGATESAAAEFEAVLGRRVVFVGTDLPVPVEELRPLAGGAGDRIEVVHRAVGRCLPLIHLDLFVSLAGRGPSGAYRLLVGSPALADSLLGREPVDHALQQHFDDVARSLADEGFDVVRNPLPLTYGDGRRAVDGVTRNVRLWYFAGANNCLVQIDPAAGDHVWLPTYGHGPWADLAVVDQANRRIWEGLGFVVHEVGDFHPFAQRLGALHCITKFLAR